MCNDRKYLTIIFIFAFFGSFILAIATEDLYKFLRSLSIMLISFIFFISCLGAIEANKEKETKQSIISQEFDEILKEDNTYNIWGIRFLLLGIFGKIAHLLSIGMIVLGAVKLLYYSRFTFQDIPTGLIPLLFLDVSLFYAKINNFILPKGEYRWSNVSRVFTDSAENLGVGVIPYSFLYLFHRFLGVWGTTIFLLALTLFIVWFYFGFGPLQMIEETGGVVKGFRGL